MKIALINENIISSIVTVSSEEEVEALAKTCQQVVDITNNDPMPTVGWILTGASFQPGPGQSAAPNMKITKLAIRQRLTMNELVAIYSVIPSDPVLQVLMDNLKVATIIDLSRPDTIAGVMYLVQAGLLSADRANIVLTTPPSLTEAYHETSVD